MATDTAAPLGSSMQEELESMVECPVHFGILVQPKTLPCGHVICLDCIRRWVEARMGILVCPECNREQILPNNGVAGLPNSYRLVTLCEYLGNLNIAASAGDAQGDATPPPAMRCDAHQGLPLDRICRECKQPACRQCAAEEHAGHVCLDATTFLKHMDHPLKKLQDQARGKQREAGRCLMEITEMKGRLEGNRGRAVDTIDIFVAKIVEQAKRAGENLKSQVYAMYHEKDRLLEGQEGALQSVIDDIEGAIQLNEPPGGLQQNLASLPPMVDDATRKLQAVEKLSIQSAPATSCDIWAEMDGTILEWFLPRGSKKIGRIGTSEVACPSESLLRIVSKTPTLLSEEVVVELTLNDGHGSRVKVQDTNVISAEVVNANGNNVHQVFENRGDGKFVTKFRPGSIGKYLLKVKAYNHKVKSSPLTVLVKPRGVSTVDLKGHPPFSGPHDVRKVGDNYLVLDNCKIEMVDKEGRMVNKFVIRDKVFHPYAVAYHEQAYYVTALKGQKVVKFSKTGLSILEIGKGVLEAPTGIAVGKDGVVYVADDKKNCIFAFSKEDGRLLHKISGPGSNSNQLSHPWFMKRNKAGNLVVADCGNRRIQVFDPHSKKCLKSIYVEHHGRPLSCRGLDVDVNDNVYVTAREPGGGTQFECVMVYSPDGDFLGSFAESPPKKGLHFVRGIHVCSSELKTTALVVDGGNSTVRFYVI